MKRGFLKRAAEKEARSSKHAKQASSAGKAGPETDDAIQESTDHAKLPASDKGKAKKSVPPPEPDPEPLSDAELMALPVLDLHRAPRGLGKGEKRRFVFRVWTRDPEGPFIRESPMAKYTGNHLTLWGETLYDFYTFSRAPNIGGYVTLSTGSRLAAAMREVGELEWAAPEIAWADGEAEPVKLQPSDIAIEIERAEAADAQTGKSMPRKAKASKKMETSESESIFDPSRYPAPWPLIPFTSEQTPKLQQKLDLHLLPRKLIVHDPWNLLFVGSGWYESDPDPTDDEPHSTDDEEERKNPKERADAGVGWTTKRDVVREYKLQLSDVNQESLKSTEWLKEELARLSALPASYEKVTIEAEESEYGITPEVIALVRTSLELPWIPEAHLYISPAHRIGTGHHSVVYSAEWELPRSALVKDKLCHMCVREEVALEMQRRHALREFPYDDWFGFHRDYEAGEIPELSIDTEAKVTYVEKHVPLVTMDLPNPTTGKPEIHIARPGKVEQTRYYTGGPTVEIPVSTKRQNATNGDSCAHTKVAGTPARAPPTAKVRVAAKLSIQHDVHLAREAQTYQKFEPHLFEHWSGYNIIPPLHDPVPLGAVVPQFYGYYVPEQPAEDSEARVQYLSPIMLIEDCGVPVDSDELDQDDKEECGSLLYRLHLTGYLHNSFAERNIVVQPGPLTEPPEKRGVNGVKSFRLIDFGRTATPKAEESQGNSKHLEEMQADKLFYKIQSVL
ncbi:hypothetical protein HWV62_24258 [Athelia sp. TMB]|nr:hypothetical protein HWV62_24258 [Athelia sp. TMB]